MNYVNYTKMLSVQYPNVKLLSVMCTAKFAINVGMVELVT